MRECLNGWRKSEHVLLSYRHGRSSSCDCENSVSQASIQAILRPMSIFRPAFRAIAQSLSDLDLIFVEEAFERLMLDYDRVFSAIHTPACLWRRTGEIYKGNKEMSVLTGIPSGWFRGGNLGIFQLMDEESIVKYYQVRITL
jgi:hypothetical protein